MFCLGSQSIAQLQQFKRAIILRRGICLLGDAYQVPILLEFFIAALTTRSRASSV